MQKGEIKKNHKKNLKQIQNNKTMKTTIEIIQKIRTLLNFE
jgi:hypothetical protein